VIKRVFLKSNSLKKYVNSHKHERKQPPTTKLKNRRKKVTKNPKLQKTKKSRKLKKNEKNTKNAQNQKRKEINQQRIRIKQVLHLNKQIINGDDEDPLNA
jgi:hypothetical protein